MRPDEAAFAEDEGRSCPDESEAFSRPLAYQEDMRDPVSGEVCRRAVRIAAGGLLVAASLGAYLGANAPAPAETVPHGVPANLQVWTRGDGLPVNAVLSLAQTRGGDLWIGTANGLARFDGQKFQTLSRRTTPALWHDDIEALAEDDEGALWIGTLGGLNVLRRGTISAYRLAGNEPCVLSLSARGSIVWVGTERGLYRIDRREPNVVRFFPSGRVRAVAELPDGTLLVGSEEGLLRLGRRGLRPFGPPADSIGRVLTILPEPDGSLWLGSSRGLYRLSGGGLTLAGSGDRPSVIRALLRTRSGDVWIGAREGLFRIEGGVPRLATSSLANEVVPALLEDRDGDVWAGTVTSGLVRLGKDPVSTFDFGDLLPDQSVWAVAADARGGIWFGTAKGRFGRVLPGSGGLEVVRQLGAPVTAIAAEPSRGTLFVATFGRGSFRYDPARESWQAAGDADDRIVLALSHDGHDGMWLGTLAGLKHLSGGRTESLTDRDGLPSNIVTTVRVDRAGAVWAGFSERGLVRVAGGKISRWTARDGLAHDAVIAIAQGSEGEMWVATAGGLSRIRDGVAKSAPPWLVDEIVESILDDGRGHLWLGTGHGIRRVAKSAFDSAAAARSEGDVLELGHSAGMRNAACSTGNASVVRTPDGRIWFGTQQGLASVDPEHVVFDGSMPAVRIDDLSRDGRSSRPGKPWTVPSGPGSIAIAYTAPSLRAAENLRFEYRLVNFDADWVRAGVRRTAYYTNLPPGRYEFRVRVREGDGPPVGPIAAQAIVVDPRWFQTLWFAAASIAAAGALLFGAHRVRVNRVREEVRLKSALERAQLSALREQLRPHFLFNTLNTILPLIRLSPETAEMVVVELSDLLRATLRSEPSQLVTFEEELRTLRQYFRIASLRFRERLDVAIQVVPEIREALVPSFLLQPLGENAIRHGVEKTAGRVHVRLSAWSDGARLHVELSNDVPGEAPAREKSPGHGIGIENTRRRLAWLYGAYARLDFSIEENVARTRITMPLRFADASRDVPDEAAANDAAMERRAG